MILKVEDALKTFSRTDPDPPAGGSGSPDIIHSSMLGFKTIR